MRQLRCVALLAGCLLALLAGTGEQRAKAFAAPAAESATAEQLAALERVLARPEFQAAERQSALDTLLEPVRTAVSGLLREVMRWLARLPAGGGLPREVGIGVGILALAVAAFGLLFVVGPAAGTLLAEAELASDGPGGPPRSDAELVRAQALARAGDLRAALHHRYLATLRRLDERGLLQFDRSLTNQEHVLRARASASLAEALTPLVAAFDGLWYSQTSCSREEYASFSVLADRVWTTA
jgi:hypothetical protein